MKNLVLVSVLIVALLGCSRSDQSKPASGVPEGSKKDYTAAAMKFLKEGDVKRSVQAFDLAIRQDPRKIENYMMLGEVYLKLNNPASAEDTFGAATRVDPTDGEAYYFLAYSRAIQKKTDLAVEAAKKSVEIFMQKQDKEKFQRAAILLKSLSASQPAASASQAVSAMAPENQ